MSRGRDAGPSTQGRWRLRLMAGSLVLVALAVVQKPGFLVADTKIDLAVDPVGFLERSLHLWDPEGAFGQVQNQAYGYLWPMGPWFLLGSALEVPGWLTQRLWVGLVMVVAFLGAAKLADVLGVGTPTSRLVAAFAYALSPRMLTTLGPISIEAWPGALAPWVLVPLVIGSSRGSPRTAAALSALAIAVVGGVNAAATSAVLPLGALWLLTRSPGLRRRSLLFWWPLFTFLGTCWWLVPLLVLGRYSPPFLDFIESAAITTVPTTLFDTLRGTSAWVPYVEAGWQAGNDLLTAGYLVLNSAILLALGIAGLSRGDLPHRNFLVVGLLAGVFLVTAGHTGVVHGWFATDIQAWLDGVLAPLRNVHKFDPVVRLPMILGLAHILGVIARPDAGQRGRTPRGERLTVPGRGLLALALVAVAGAAAPAWSGRLTPQGEFVAVPDYWYETADWLSREDAARALLLPGSSFGTYAWGRPRDEPLQVLATSPWAVRDAVPLAPPGTIRMLDAIESRLASGRGSDGLAPYLRRAGVSHLVLRNDLVRGSDITDPLLVRQAVSTSPGIIRVARFGPEVGGDATVQIEGRRVVVGHGWQSRLPAVEVYEVVSTAKAHATTDPPLVVGGPEDLLDLADHGLVGSSPTLLAVDAPAEAAEAPLVLTDGLRRRERTFGRIHDGLSHTLTPGEERRPTAPAREYQLSDRARWETRAELIGARAIEASSAMSDATAPGMVRPEHQPWSAFDGESETEWVSAPQSDEAWIELTLAHARRFETVEVTGGQTLGDTTQLFRIVTDEGRSEVYELAPAQRIEISLPSAGTRRIRLEGAHSGRSARLAIADISLDGVDLARPLRTPVPRRSWPDPSIVLLRAEEGSSGCVTVDGDVRCSPERQQMSEEPFVLDRIVSLHREQQFTLETTAVARGGETTEVLIQEDQLVTARASSAAVDAPVGSAVAAIDGDPGTTWVADVDDERPTMRLNWLGPTRISALSFDVDPEAPATPPTSVTVAYPGGQQTVEVDSLGGATIDPVLTTQLELRLHAETLSANIGFDNVATPLAIGVSELRIRGLEALPAPPSADEREYRCGSGPTAWINGVPVRTALWASPRSLFLGEPVDALPCGESVVQLRSGENRVELKPSAGLVGRSVTLKDEAAYGAALTAGGMPLAVDEVSPVERKLRIPRVVGPAAVAVHQNFNEGWTAGLGGETVDSIILDGWQQGWVIPAGAAGELTMSYGPDRVYRAGLLAGAVASGVLLLYLLARLLQRTSRRRAAPAALSERVVPGVVVAAVGLVALGLVAGWPGVAATAVVVVAHRSAGARAGRSWPWVAAFPVLLAALIYASRPLGSNNDWAGALALPQYLTALSLAGVLAAGLRRDGIVRRRMKGRSTTR